MERTLYRRVLGDDFGKLPKQIRDMHTRAFRATGRADIVRGRSLLARLICAFSRLPATGLGVPVVTTFDPIEGGERWTRVFNNESFQTDIMFDDKTSGALTERFGPFVFTLKMLANEEGNDLVPESVKLWGIALPRFLCPEAIGRERVKNGLYHFDVVVRFPLSGDVVRYDGVLSPDFTAPA